MGKFRANTDDAYILTNIQNQESGDSDWAKYQVVTKDKSRLPLHNNTTNNLLKVFKDTTQVHDIFGDGSAIATYTLDGNANDLGGNHNGTWHGTEQYDTGRFRQAARCIDGSYIYLTNRIFNIHNDSFTITFFVNPDDNGVIFAYAGETAGIGRAGYYFTNEMLTYATSTSASSVVTFSEIIPLNKWSYIIIENDASTDSLSIYKNGELIATVSLSNIYWYDTYYKPRGIFIGGYTDPTGSIVGGFTGLIDQVRIFNRVLTEDEITFLYHEGLTHIRKHDQLIIYNATDGAKIHEVISITDNDTDKTYDIDISDLSLTEAPTNAHQLTKSVDLTDKIDTSNTTATTLVLQDALENPTLVKNGETLIIDDYKLENINVTRSLDGGNIKYSIDISSFNRVPLEVVLIKPRVEISVGDQDKANADDLVLDVLDSTTTSVTVGYYEETSKRARIKNTEKIDTDTGLGLSLIEVVEEYLDPTKVDLFNDNSEVAFYQLDGNANDAHNQYNGTWSGTEQYDIGRFGQAAKFDGSSYINTGYKTQDLINNNSFSLWVKANPNDNASVVEFFGYRDANNRGSLSLSWANSSDELRLMSSGGTDAKKVIYSGINAIINEWVYICGVYENETQTLYINGTKIGSSSLGSSGTTNYDIYVGWAAINSKLNGFIDQVRIFNRALTEDEVKYLYNEGKYKFNLNLQSEQSSAPTKAIIRPTIQDILELDQNNTAYDNTNDLVNVYYQPIQKGNGFRSVQVKWNAHRQGDENSSLRVNLWKKAA